jgi:hypothetical protein
MKGGCIFTVDIMLCHLADVRDVSGLVVDLWYIRCGLRPRLGACTLPLSQLIVQ